MVIDVITSCFVSYHIQYSIIIGLMQNCAKCVLYAIYIQQFYIQQDVLNG